MVKSMLYFSRKYHMIIFLFNSANAAPLFKSAGGKALQSPRPDLVRERRERESKQQQLEAAGRRSNFVLEFSSLI